MTFRIHDEDRKLYNAVTDWLADSLVYFDTYEQAAESIQELIGDWIHMWLQDVKEKP